MNKNYLYFSLSLLINGFNAYVVDLYINNLVMKDYLLGLPMVIFSVSSLNIMTLLIRSFCAGENSIGYLIAQMMNNILYVLFTIGIFFSLNSEYNPLLTIILINICGQLIHCAICLMVYLIISRQENRLENNSTFPIIIENPLIHQLKSYPLKGFEEMETRYLIKEQEIYLNSENKINPMTLEDFKINDEIIVLSCHHYF